MVGLSTFEVFGTLKVKTKSFLHVYNSTAFSLPFLESTFNSNFSLVESVCV